MAKETDDSHGDDSMVKGDPAKSVEDLMHKLASSNITKAAPMPKRTIQKDFEDCLDEAGKEKKVHPEYKVRVSSPHKKGYSFGSDKDRSQHIFISRDLTAHIHRGRDSPGPTYTPASFTDHPSKPQSFPKAARSTSNKTKKKETSPGPQYDISGSLGRQPTKGSAPAVKIGASQRFTSGQYISSAHNKALMNSESPAPNHYSPAGDEQGPSYSFSSGGRDVKVGKLFVSKEHAQKEYAGHHSPGPMYSWDTELIAPAAPSYSFGMSDRAGDNQPQRASSCPPRASRFLSREHAKVDCGRDSPGPGCYEAPSPQKTRAPAYTFGVVEKDSSKRFVSRDLVSYGRESPGPRYKPSERLVKKTTPGAVFAGKDPTQASLVPRYTSKQFISTELAFNEMAGRASPGPAAYSTETTKVAPAYSMGRKEKLLMKRICPGPERARFISKELARENIGAYSPGPKYKVPGSIGEAGVPKYSFGLSDRSFEDIPIELKEKMGTISKPYTTPGEARFLSKELQALAMLGKYSPGPKYNPDRNTVSKSVPAYTIGRKWKAEKNAVPSAEEHEEERKKLKAKPANGQDVTVKNAPRMKFGTSKRGLLSGEEGKARTVAGKDSPGPVYQPNFESISKKTPGVSIGGLH